MSRMGTRRGAPKLTAVHVRLYTEDVRALKKLAADRELPWNIELRQLVRGALRGHRREIAIIKE